jgi:hypothetical protein
MNPINLGSPVLLDPDVQVQGVSRLSSGKMEVGNRKGDWRGHSGLGNRDDGHDHDRDHEDQDEDDEEDEDEPDLISPFQQTRSNKPFVKPKTHSVLDQLDVSLGPAPGPGSGSGSGLGIGSGGAGGARMDGSSVSPSKRLYDQMKESALYKVSHKVTNDLSSPSCIPHLESVFDPKNKPVAFLVILAIRRRSPSASYDAQRRMAFRPRWTDE